MKNITKYALTALCAVAVASTQAGLFELNNLDLTTHKNQNLKTRVEFATLRAMYLGKKHLSQVAKARLSDSTDEKGQTSVMVAIFISSARGCQMGATELIKNTKTGKLEPVERDNFGDAKQILSEYNMCKHDDNDNLIINKAAFDDFVSHVVTDVEKRHGAKKLISKL
ncbi:hypothetical protein HOK96_02690 [bacterium]|nr:hypothetical protein [bacterium]MBT4577902.1 hypothetical protein [bacterium]MBT5345925.1 hypothetical protein [bacterium]MBT6131115.1 hypothetical protein [bacterium]